MKHDQNMLMGKELGARTESPFVRYLDQILRYGAHVLRLARSSQDPTREGKNRMFEEIEVPSDGQVIEVLQELHGAADARALCARLMEKGHGRLESQLAIQRTAERGKIVLRDDWTFSAVELEAA